ncbi:hypothetical protein BsWGS_02129 [Bradybaena similaris]
MALLVSDATTELFLLTLIVCVHTSIATEVVPQGHLKKLGSHRDPSGITMIGKFSAPAVFYEHFVKPGKPLWMRSVLSSAEHPGLTSWTDAFFRKHFGSETVKIETSRKENRKSNPKWLTFQQFLSSYETDDIYMVQTLKDKMEELALIPTSLQCGGFQRAIQEAVMWLGSGNAASVLHRDDLDNLLCLLDGRKEFVLIDKVYKHEVESHGFLESEGYSLVNTAKVDLFKFPLLATLPWHEVHLNKGDCIFIPRGWYHQVNSNEHRHLAINIWFSHLFWFNHTNCSNDQEFHKPLEPISTFGFATPNEVYRSKLLEKMYDKGLLLKNVVVESLDSSTPERRSQFFDAVDKYKDSVLSWSELYAFDIDKAIAKFPDIFGLPGNSLSRTNEEIILYEPVRKVNDDLADEDNKYSFIEVPQGKEKEHHTEKVVSDELQGKDFNEPPSLLPDDPTVEGGSKENNLNEPPSLLPDYPTVEGGSRTKDINEPHSLFPDGPTVESASKQKYLNEPPSLVPDDATVEGASREQDDWLHNDLYSHTDVGEADDIHNAHEHTEHSYYSYTESQEDLKVHESADKTQDLKLHKSADKDEL